jgi:hypothetical protein
MDVASLALSGALGIALGAAGCRPRCVDFPGGGPDCTADASSSIDDPYLVPTAATAVVAGLGFGVEVIAAADDDLELRPAVHVALAVVGAGTVALGTASAIYNRDRSPRYYLPGPIIAGLTGLPLIVISVYNLVVDRSPPASPGAMVSCTSGRCRPGIPSPLVTRDVRGAPAPGLRIVEARF